MEVWKDPKTVFYMHAKVIYMYTLTSNWSFLGTVHEFMITAYVAQKRRRRTSNTFEAILDRLLLQLKS